MCFWCAVYPWFTVLFLGGALNDYASCNLLGFDMRVVRQLIKRCIGEAVRSRPFRKMLKLVDYELAPYREIQEPRESLTEHLAAVLARNSINLVLDVGANKGQTGMRLRRIGYHGRIVSFEPVGRYFGVLASRAKEDPNWQCYQLALGSRDVEDVINLARHSVFDSFLSPSDYSADHFREDSEIVDTEVVQVRRLDTVIADCIRGLDSPRIFLKLDTQGFDLEVVAGASGSLQHVIIVQTELSVKPIYKSMVGYLEAMHRLNALGFEITGLFPVNRDSKLRVIEFDCVLVRA